MRALITILDCITETSMPYNEFVLYRAKHYADEKQILIVCGRNADKSNVTVPGDLKVYYTGRKINIIRKTVKEIITELRHQSTPYVVHLHQVQSGFLSEIAMIGTGFREKVVFTVHSTFSGYKLHNKVLSAINACLAREIVCVSESSYRFYPTLIKRTKNKHIRVIHNGVDTERIDEVISTSQHHNNDKVIFIYVARLIPIKNHVFLLDVIKKCDEKAHFIFVGEEDSAKSIRKKTEECGLVNRITFTGLVSRNEVFKILKNADYYISSSTLEGLPVSVLEAMYCGLPCVLSDIPQHREIAGDKITILLPYDVDKWATEINRLLNISKEQRMRAGQELKAYISEHYCLSGMHSKYNEVYDVL